MRAIATMAIPLGALGTTVVTAAVLLSPAPAGAGTAPPPPPLSAAATSDDAALLQLVSDARQAAGLALPAVHPDLTSWAQEHARAQAANGAPFHDPAMGSALEPWLDLGEVVGVGASLDELEQLWLASDLHRGHLLGGYSEVGVGTAWSDGRIYAAVVLRLPPAAAPTAGSGVSRPTTGGADADAPPPPSSHLGADGASTAAGGPPDQEPAGHVPAGATAAPAAAATLTGGPDHGAAGIDPEESAHLTARLVTGLSATRGTPRSP